MVGVPGKSKGCVTCRRRKKGCDKKRPSCGQCETAHITCEGYDLPSIFVHAKQGDGKNKAIYAKEDGRAAQQRVRSASPGTIVLHDSLQRSATQEKYVSLYWSSYMPNARSLSSRSHHLSVSTWIDTVDQLYASEPTIRIIMVALSLSMLGNRDKNEQLKLRGLQTYTQAVRETAVAVSSPTRAKGDGLLAAVRLMGWHEMLYGSEGDKYTQMGHLSQIDGWNGHVNGQANLFLARGPEGFRYGPGHRLFADGRLNTLFSAIPMRQKSPFASLAWRTIPWTVQAKSVKDKLIDVLAQVTVLIADLDTMRNEMDLDRRRSLRKDLLAYCYAVEEELATFEDEMGPQLMMYDYHIVDGPLPEPMTGEDLALLHLSHFYWIACIMLYSTTFFATIASLPDPEPCPWGEPSTLSSCVPHLQQLGKHTLINRQYRQTAPKAYAYKLAYSLRLAYIPRAGDLGPHTAAFPLGVTLSYLLMAEGFDSEVKKMAGEVLHRPFMGKCVSVFLRNIGGQDDNVDPGALLEKRAKNIGWWYKGTPER